MIKFDTVYMPRNPVAAYKCIPEKHRKNIVSALENGNHKFLDQFHEYKYEAKELVEPIAKKRIENELKHPRLPGF